MPPFPTAEDVYLQLTATPPPPGADAFDVHIVAAIFALATVEARERALPLSETCGLDAAEQAELIRRLCPGAGWSEAPDVPLVRDAGEAALVDLLVRGATSGSRFRHFLAEMIARRAQCPNHLWQDLGLQDRGELSRLMNRHFAPLARRNVGDMKWKKFFYRQMCRDEAYALCRAPSCDLCADFTTCFGDESGESRLARICRIAAW